MKTKLVISSIFLIIVLSTFVIAQSGDNSTNTSSAASIKVLSPNGGEVWHRGETHRILWESTNLDKVDILIYVEDPNNQFGSGAINYITLNEESVLASNSASKGEYDWNIPQYSTQLPPFTTSEDPTLKYHILVRGIDSNSGISDSSDSPFSILPPENQTQPPQETTGEVYTCTDSDGGKNYYTNGQVIEYVNGNALGSGRDYCEADGIRLVEFSCSDDHKTLAEDYSCPNRCNNGACLGTPPENVNNQENNANTRGGNGNKETTNSSQSPSCNGCLSGNLCLPIGFRQKTSYCSTSLNFIQQKNSDESCENSFECSSSLCISNKCVSPSLIESILNWFRNLFGLK